MIRVELWTDGSGTTRGNPGGWAFVLTCTHPVTGEEKTVEGSGGAEDTTNNRMEMTALLMGLRALSAPAHVVVHSDSQYVIGGMSGNKRKTNVDLWEALDHAEGEHFIEYVWVKGHAGSKWNERCDVLAGQERRRLLDAVDS